MEELFRFYNEEDTEDSIVNRDYLEELKEENSNKYIKVVYQSDPIGEYGIVLELTTFDFEAYEKDEKLKKKTQHEKIDIKKFQVDNVLDIDLLENHLNKRVDEFYKSELIKMKNIIEKNKKNNFKVIKGNIYNSENIVCEIIQGNVVNCDNVKCKEIKGNTINCSIRKENL